MPKPPTDASKGVRLRENAVDASQEPVGLSSPEAAARLAQFGLNEPGSANRYSALREFASAFTNPLVLILIGAAAVSIFVGEAVDATLIVVIVLIGTVMNFLQSHRSQKAAERLRAQVTPTATVKRDGAWIELPRRQVVPEIGRAHV